MNYQNVVNYASIFSGILVFADNFLAKEYLHLFLRFSWMTSLSFAGLKGYEYYLKYVEDSQNTSYDAITDLDSPATLQHALCPESIHVVKLGESTEYLFLILPGETEAKLLVSQKDSKGMKLTISKESLELASKDFWYGPVKIIKL